MTAIDTFDRDLEGFLELEAPVAAPTGLHDDVIAQARRSRQRPGWLVAMRGGTVGTGRGFSPGGVSYLLVVLALLLAALLVAIAGGAFRSNPFNPQLGRNGSIVFDLQDLSAGVRVVNPDGSGHHEIAGGNCPSYSPDGSVLAYWSGSSSELVVAAADGSAPRRLSVFAEGGHPEDRFALSPDGTQFAWVKRLRAYERTAPDGSSTVDGWDDELWVMPVSGGPGTRILPVSGALNESRVLPLWSPDGRRIAYATYAAVADELGRSSIDVIDADGSNRIRLMNPAWGMAGMTWSPDGRFIAYARGPEALPAASTSPPGDSPGNGPPLDVFVVGSDGTGERNLTNSPDSEQRPQWSPDGAHLAYLTPSVAQRIDTVRMNGPRPIGPPALGPQVSPFYAWSPDGTMLLVIRETPTGATDRLRRARSTILVVDPEFLRPSTTLVEVDYLVLCAPSWQRLDP